jgi:phosphoribosyl 1,2-cyclic phosphate phosphodiesterase
LRGRPCFVTATSRGKPARQAAPLRLLSWTYVATHNRAQLRMKITFLGTGTSAGIPLIGCACPVCTSNDPRNRRLRTSLYVQAGGTHIVIDTPPDFREQALRFKLPRVDAVLFTHTHADHVFGLDDIRRFNTIQNGAIPAYASADSLADLTRIFDYVLKNDHPPGTYRPELVFTEIKGHFQVGPMRGTPLNVVHGGETTLGFRIEAGGRTLGYVPDCHEMPDATLKALAGVDVMVLDALRYRPHPTHLTVDQSVAILQRIAAPRSYLIHMCHDVDHADAQRRLPAGMFMSYDGLTLEW